MKDEKLRKIILKKVRIYLTVIVLILLIFGCAFGYFKIYTEGRTAFREAKNIKIALSLLSVEYYGKGYSVYDPTKRDGLTEGVESRLDEVIETGGNTTILAYDYAEREVTSFVYETGNYRVYYKKGKNKTQWKVKYCLQIMSYEE